MSVLSMADAHTYPGAVPQPSMNYLIFFIVVGKKQFDKKPFRQGKVEVNHVAPFIFY